MHLSAASSEQARFGILTPDPDKHRAAHEKFVAERKSVPANDITRMCSLTMTLGNVFGAHPNASGFGLLGSGQLVREGILRLPLRATSPETIRWHTTPPIVARVSHRGYLG